MKNRPSDINILKVRSVLGTKEWLPAKQLPCYDRNGQPGVMWELHRRDATALVIISVDNWEDHAAWIHASMSCRNPPRVPTYEELKFLHQAVFGIGWAYQVFSPPVEHVNIHPYTLHLWGRIDGERVLPNFAVIGAV